MKATKRRELGAVVESGGRVLRVLSWNLAMMDRSEEAPENWTLDDTDREIRAVIREKRPDLVHFQELPDVVECALARSLEGYRRIPAEVQSHCGWIVSYFRSDLVDGLKDDAVVAVPGVGVVVTLDEVRTSFVNVHLAPFKGGAPTRLEAMKYLVERVPLCNRVVIAGDTNTRADELVALKSQCGITAIARESDGKPSSPITWDGFRNKFHGSESFPFRASFSRVLTKGDVKAKDPVQVLQDPITRSGTHFFLSDHFALLVDIKIETLNS